MSLLSLPQTHGEDLMNMMCGNLIGSGCYRHVYAGKQDASLVFKYERTFERGCNRAEMELWGEMQDHPLGQWLAPCVGISPDGTWLIQRRTEPLQFAQLPKEVPRIFCDTKIDNWGMYDGRVVCHDYGNNNMLYSLARKYGTKLEPTTWRGRS